MTKIFWLLSTSSWLLGGPVNFGLDQYNAAIAARNLKWKVKYEITADPPESYRIEPYKFGGAHVTGGDLRGLMYGLLEAANQIRSTGRLKQVHAEPAAHIRGVRIFARNAPPDWRAFLEMLARDRFNRLTLIYTEPPRDLETLRAVSQDAADYAIDFTLALWEYEPDAALAKVLSACPLIRAVQVRTTSHDLATYRQFVLDPLRNAGRRIALDPEPEMESPARQSGVAVRADPLLWPPPVELDASSDYAAHSLLYFVYGRAAYDPKTNPPAGTAPEEFRAASRIAALMAMLDAPPNGWTASIAEAVRNRVEQIASAKKTPLETAAELIAAASVLEKSAAPDFRLLASAARDRAEKERAAYRSELSAAVPPPAAAPPIARRLPRPQLTESPVKTATIGHPIQVSLQISPVREATVVRLYYRPLNGSELQRLEKPAAASVTFTIPGCDADLLYYFEILNRENTGWFAPDPAAGAPYRAIRIEPLAPNQD